MSEQQTYRYKSHVFENREAYDAYILQRMKQRLDADLRKGDLDKAIQRLEGFNRKDPNNQALHNLTGELYLKRDDKVQAGKHFYFKSPKNDLELECVIEFEKSLGYDPSLILKNLLYKNNHKIKSLGTYPKKELARLLLEVESKHGLIPKFLIEIQNHLKSIGMRE